MDLLDFDVAQSRLASAGKPLQNIETLSLREARGRILAETVTATLDLPPADNSAMDGYAIRFADYQAGVALPVQQRCFAGQTPDPLQPGKATRLFTGSLLPAGADTIIMQEVCVEADDKVTIQKAPQLGAQVRRRGEDIKQGSHILTAGTVIEGAHITLLASQGLAQVKVYARPKIGILSNGDELAEPGQPLRAAQVYNSNGVMLAALVEKLGAQVVHVLHAVDTHDSLHHAFTQLLTDCDLVLTVGGASVGEKDLVKGTIEQMGGTVDLWRVRMKPGKPVALASALSKPVVCLPGNPVSAYVVFTVLVSPLIRAMQGRATTVPGISYGKLDGETVFHESRDEFLRVQAHHHTDGTTSLAPYAQQGSGITSSLPWATGLARIPANTSLSAGDLVAYYDFAHWQV